MGYPQRGYVYGIYDLEQGLLKIGETTRPDYRFGMFGVGHKDHMKLLFCLEAPYGLHRRIEALVQECVGNAREHSPHLPCPTEWYRVSLQHARTLGRIAAEFAALLAEEPSSNSRYQAVQGAIDAARNARTRVIRRD